MSTQNLEELWLDRDLTWLEFNRRVLAEALDERTPLLERLKFLAIFTSNLDEFFMKRIAVLRVENNGTHTKLLADLRAVVVGMVQQQQACFTALLPRLEQHGVRLLAGKISAIGSGLRRQNSSSKMFCLLSRRWLLTRRTRLHSFPTSPSPGCAAYVSQAPRGRFMVVLKWQPACLLGSRSAKKAPPVAVGSSI
jgi:Polyphosphate kinase N-terminal domain